MHLSDTLYTRVKKCQTLNPMTVFHSFSDCSLKLIASEIGLTAKQMFNFINGYRIPPDNIRANIERLANQLDYERKLFVSEIENNNTNLRNGLKR